METIRVHILNCLSAGDTQAAAGLLASDLEWRFHGPPGREYMMHILIGVDDACLCGFRFDTVRIADAGRWVVADGQGFGGEYDVYWVHAWAVEGGVITQFREYFDTLVTIQEFGTSGRSFGKGTVWESRESGTGRQLPAIVLPL
ncbi:hypothetical protein KSP40_PGU006818 [Platanthera guangdongensis]|uniref:SnoaL-like domain-containing protein n=1 Tax=Platanthera guangdongensis TaxID=2320717 RepID=A0ABR2M808_9ASPA